MILGANLKLRRKAPAAEFANKKCAGFSRVER
jgi:hypothetical protein